jgi:hypothetical protein
MVCEERAMPMMKYPQGPPRDPKGERKIRDAAIAGAKKANKSFKSPCPVVFLFLVLGMGAVAAGGAKLGLWLLRRT